MRPPPREEGRIIMKQYIEPRQIIHASRLTFRGDDPLATIRLPQRSLSSHTIPVNNTTMHTQKTTVSWHRFVYLRQRGYVSAFVSLSVIRIAQRIVDEFQQNFWAQWDVRVVTNR